MNASTAIEKLGTSRTIGPISLKSIFANFPERWSKKGDTILKRNHSLGYIFLLTEGVIKTLSSFPDKKKEIVNAYYTVGDLINLEVWHATHNPKITLKVSSDKAVYKVIPVNDFRALVQENQCLNQLMMTTLLNQINRNNIRLHRLLLNKSRQRVIQFLLDYINRVGVQVGMEHVVKKPFTHEEIGSLADTSRQTVTTVLNELKAKNLIHFTRRYLLVRNMKNLENESRMED